MNLREQLKPINNNTNNKECEKMKLSQDELILKANEIRREYMRAYRKAHKEQSKQYMKTYWLKKAQGTD